MIRTKRTNEERGGWRQLACCFNVLQYIYTNTHIFLLSLRIFAFIECYERSFQPQNLFLSLSASFSLCKNFVISLTVFVFSLFSLERETKTKNSRFLFPNFRRLCLQFVHSQHTRKVMTKATGLSSSFRYYRSPK